MAGWWIAAGALAAGFAVLALMLVWWLVSARMSWHLTDGLPSDADAARGFSWPATSQDVARAVGSSIIAGVRGHSERGGDVPALPAGAARLVAGSKVSSDLISKYEACLGRESSTAPGRPSPMLFLHSASFGMQLSLLTCPRLPFGLIGSVHYACRVFQLRPLHLASPLRVRAEFGRAARPHRRGSVVDVNVRAWLADDGETAPERVRVTNSFLFFHRRSRFDAGERPPADEPVRGPGDGELRIGVEHASAWAALTGDVNPIHMSDVAAQLLGVARRRIVHGMCALDMAMPALLRAAAAATLAEADAAKAGAAMGSSPGMCPEAMLPACVEVKFTRPLEVPATVRVAVIEAPKDWAVHAGEPPAVFARLDDGGSGRAFQEVALTTGDAAHRRAFRPIP